jgi:hypothetical protein
MRHPLRRSLPTWLIAAATASTTASAATAQDPQTPAVRADFGTLGEGLTSEGAGDPIEAGYRMFSVPDFGNICRQARATDVARLRPGSSRVRLRVGRPYALNSLEILAFDSAGSVLPKVPIGIESEIGSDILDVRSDRIGNGSVTATRPGSVRFRIRTICNGPTVETFFTAEVIR